ncbi:hypothetical protein B0H17DRAFT_1142469 [Mycena rosella]|uniref:Uncharacterized protein n=1 Tax=Mycena rosella TaxID=1033263 RepID=A0AAD7G915_MYCRO|nr:hypothetical protein B0H17DRAFT_1142469 [Mycena rosella]
MFYFTLQPRRDKNALRSFLSLDLAESQSLRSHSMRRKSSTRRHSREPPFAVDFQIPDSPSLLPPPSPMSMRRSPGRSPASSLRPLPSPKPAPVATLPSVPSHPSTPRTPRTPRSPGLEVVISRTPTPVAIQAAPPQRKASLVSQVTRASATSSTVSTRYRRTRRNKALACLEGRRPLPAPASPSDNFMSMSEDEEEEEGVAVPRAPSPDLPDLSLSGDQLIMLIAGLDDGDVHSAPASSPPRSKPSSRESSTPTPASPPRRRRTSLVLKSFMDFHNDEDSSRWSWRSFIEVAT